MFGLLKRLRDLFLVRIIWRKYQIGRDFHAGARVRLWSKNKLIIGDHFYIGRDSQIACDAIIGDYVGFANKVGLIGPYDHNFHQVGLPMRLSSRIQDCDYNWKGDSLKVEIEDDVWVGYGSIILSGVKIGQGSVIAAGSLVTRNVDPFSIYGGVPARKIGERFENEIDLHEHIRLYNLNYKKKK